MSEEKKIKEKYQEQLKRPEEFSSREYAEFLWRKRAGLPEKKHWYNKLGNWLGIIAILVSISFSGIQLIISHEEKELTIIHSPPHSFFALASSFKPKVDINYDNKPINNLSKFSIRLQNTGTKAISKDDFKDGPIIFEIVIKEKSINTNIPYILDVVEKSSAGQINQELQIINSFSPAKIMYLPSIINPAEIVEFEIYTSTNEDFNLKIISGKIADGNLKNAGKLESEFDGLALLFSTFKNMFGSNLLTIGVFLLLFILSVSFMISVWNQVGFPHDFETLFADSVPILFTSIFLLIFICSLIF